MKEEKRGHEECMTSDVGKVTDKGKRMMGREKTKEWNRGELDKGDRNG